jgi:hypothetical protein
MSNIPQNSSEPPREGHFLVYQNEDGQPRIEVRLEGETVWLTQQTMAALFQTSRTNIVEHIKHIYEEGELSETATCRNFRQVQIEGTRSVTREIPHYNLDAIISVGYRVKSAVATRFRIWATQRLCEFKELAEAEYEKFNHARIRQSDAVESDFDKAIKKLPPSPKKPRNKNALRQPSARRAKQTSNPSSARPRAIVV